jgi:hypothetical protein
VSLALGTAPRTLAVEPITHRAARQLKLPANITEGKARGPQSKGTLSKLRGMHSRIIQLGYDSFCGAGDGSRTRMPSQANDFESFV